AHDEQDQVRLLDRPRGLCRDLAAHRGRVRVVDASGVHQLEGLPAPVRAGLPPVARDPGARVHDGVAAADEAVEERRLADVREAHDRDERLAGGDAGGRRRPARAPPRPALRGGLARQLPRPPPPPPPVWAPRAGAARGQAGAIEGSPSGGRCAGPPAAGTSPAIAVIIRRAASRERSDRAPAARSVRSSDGPNTTRTGPSGRWLP